MSTDGGSVWNQVDSYLGDGGCLASDPVDTNIFYAGGIGSSTGAASVCRSTNGGSAWGTRRDLGTNYGTCYDIEVAPSSHMTVYAAGDDSAPRVWRSTNGGDVWTDVTGNLVSLTGEWESVYALWVDPADSNKVVVGTSTGVYRTSNGGTTWIATSLTYATRDLVYDPAGSPISASGTARVASAGSGTLYAGTQDNGVYYSCDGGDTWVETNEGLGCPNVLCLALDPVNHVLFAGTDGQAIWRFQNVPTKAKPSWSRYK
jgi:hypothetical protein